MFCSRLRSRQFAGVVIVVGLFLSSTPALGLIIPEDIKLLPSGNVEGDLFGFSIDTNDGVVAIGAVGDEAAYLFDAATGELILKLLPDDGVEDDQFGISIAIDDGVVVVGANKDDDSGSNSGSVYLFDATTGEQLYKLIASDGDEDDSFGYSVSISNGRIAVGAPSDDDSGSSSGSAYVFLVDTGNELFKLLPSDGTVNDQFGRSVSIRGGTTTNHGFVAVGSPQDDDNGSNSGSVYLFDSFTGDQTAKLLPSDGAGSDAFGNSVDILDASVFSNTVVVIGAAGNDDNGDESGSAYLFSAITGDQIYKLLPSDGAEDDLFGISVAVNNDFIAIGAYGDNDNGIDSGSTYLFDVSTGIQTDKFVPTDGTPLDRFGIVVAIDDGILAVSTGFDDERGVESGSAYTFDVDTGDQLTKLFPTDGSAGDSFGNSIDISDGVIAVGAVWDDDNGSNSGSAYLLDAATGDQIAKLLPSDGTVDDFFGYSIAIDNQVVAVGSINDDDRGSSSGSAYLFDALTGELIAKVLPGDGAMYDDFGSSVAINGNIIAVGAPGDSSESGAVYLFEINVGTVVQTAKLIPIHREPFTNFGRSVAINSQFVVIGAPNSGVSGVNAGATYVFDISTGDQLFKLFAGDEEPNAHFGYSVAIDNGTIAVGAVSAHDLGPSSGSAYLFDATTGTQLFKLLPSDGAEDDEFGYSVAIENGVVAVGAYQSMSGGPGAVYLFDATTGIQTHKLLPSDSTAGDEFGSSIAFDVDQIAVGSPRDDDNGLDSGSAYIFSVPDADCPADLTGDGSLNFFDVSAFLSAFGELDPIADFNGDGSFNFFDVSAFLAAFSAGCP